MTKRNAAGERPVFDVAIEATAGRAFDTRGDGVWAPRHMFHPKAVSIRLPGDGPSAKHRVQAGIAWYSSHRYSGQASNDNQDWPLAKLLRTEGNDAALSIAERYRALYDAANDPVELFGQDASEAPISHRLEIDEATGKLKDKGEQRIGPAKAANWGLRTDPSQPRPVSKPFPKPWRGDVPIVNQIDAQRDLAMAQAALGWLREAFEAAVVGGETLEAIGRDHGVGNAAGAKGAGRALVFLGLQAIDALWQRRSG